MSPRPADEFAIGWAARLPPGLARWTRHAAAILVLAALGAIAVAAATQARQPEGLHEYGHLRTFEGVLRAEPVPRLVGATASGEPGVPDSLVLTGPGKFGIDEAARALEGRRVRFRGTLIRRDLAMAELTERASLEDLGPAGAQDMAATASSLGRVQLTGELVDTKCWLGVMRPGNGKVHRACAIRCLSGGVPPGLLVRRDDDALVTILLRAPAPAASAEGVAPPIIDPQFAARLLRVQGELEIRDGMPVLSVERWELADAS